MTKLPKVLPVAGREKLSEGRNHQMGFSFAEEVKENVFKPIHPISPCKDYLNDVVYTEKTGKEVQAYGLTTKKLGIWEGKPVFMVFKICPRQGQKDYPGMKKDVKNLFKNYKNIETILHYVEEKLGFKDRTILMRATVLSYVCVMPKEWVQDNYLTSLYTLLCRMAQFYNGKMTPEEFLNKYDNPLDKSLWQAAKPKYEDLLKNGLFVQSYEGMYGSMIHNAGICGAIKAK